MVFIKDKIKILVFLLVGLFMLQACNKEFEDTPETVLPPAPTGNTINDIINTDTSFSFLKAAVAKAGLGSTLGNTSLRLTAFFPDNNAFRRSGISSLADLNARFDTATTRSILNYNITPQLLPAEQIPTSFPNLQAPSILNPAPTVSAFLRLSIF